MLLIQVAREPSRGPAPTARSWRRGANLTSPSNPASPAREPSLPPTSAREPRRAASLARCCCGPGQSDNSADPLLLREQRPRAGAAATRLGVTTALTRYCCSPGLSDSIAGPVRLLNT